MHPIADPPSVEVLADATIHQNLPVEGNGYRLRHRVDVQPAETDGEVVDVDDDAERTVRGGEVVDTVVVAAGDDGFRSEIS